MQSYALSVCEMEPWFYLGDSTWLFSVGAGLGNWCCYESLWPEAESLGNPGPGESGGVEERLHLASWPCLPLACPTLSWWRIESEDFRQLCWEMYLIVPVVDLCEGRRWNPQGKNNMWIKPCCYYSFFLDCWKQTFICHIEWSPKASESVVSLRLWKCAEPASCWPRSQYPHRPRPLPLCL